MDDSNTNDGTSNENSLCQALLSPTTSLPCGEDIHNNNTNLTTPASMLAGNIESSPSRSFVETSFYTNLRAIHYPFLPGEDDDDDGSDTEGGDNPNDQDEAEIQKVSPMIRFLDRVIARGRIGLLAAIVLLLWPCGVLSFHELLRRTDSSMTFQSPIRGSPSAAAQGAFRAAYQESMDWQDVMRHPPLVIVLESNTTSLTNPSSYAYSLAKTFALELAPALNRQCNLDATANIDATVAGSTTPEPPWLQVTSYYSLQQDRLGAFAKTMTALDGRITMIQIQYKLPTNFTGNEKARIFTLMDALDEYTAKHGYPRAFSVRYTGMPYFQRDLIQSSRTDMARMVMFALPLALILVSVALLPGANPLVVWIVPLVCMITACSAWSIAMRYVVQVMPITQFTPVIMMSLSLGMGMNYSLLLLTRYVEETPLKNRRKAVLRMWTKAGNACIISGTALVCTFLCLCILPLQTLQSLGVGAAITIVCAVLSNLLVVPAMLYTSLGKWIVQGRAVAEQPTTTMSREASAWMVSSYNSAAENDPLYQLENSTFSVWFWLAKQLLHPHKGIIIFLVACQFLLPVGWFAFKFKSSISLDVYVPADTSSMGTHERLGDALGPGRLYPYRILFDGNQAGIQMTSSRGFDIMNQVIRELRFIDFDRGVMEKSRESIVLETMDEEMNALMAMLLPSERPTTTVYNGISVLNNQEISHRTYAAAKICGRAMEQCPIQLLHLIDVLDRSTTSRNEKATFVSATLSVDPFSDQGLQWLRAARAKIEQMSDSIQGVQVHIEGVPAVEKDAVHAVYNDFPRIFLVAMLVVFTLTGIFMKSAFAPFRSILGILLTVGFSFGLGVLVFQYGMLNWTNVRSLESLGDSFCWLVPVMAFSIIVGLALDYDVFLMNRTLEFRLEGFDHDASIAAALHETGGIMACRGIMVLAFGSLLFSSSSVLYQWSFVLTTAVILDTFVVRAVVVPILTSFASCFWWPRALPEAQYHLACFQRASDEDVRNLLNALEESSEYVPIVRSTESGIGETPDDSSAEVA